MVRIQSKALPNSWSSTQKEVLCLKCTSCLYNRGNMESLCLRKAFFSPQAGFNPSARELEGMLVATQIFHWVNTSWFLSWGFKDWNSQTTEGEFQEQVFHVKSFWDSKKKNQVPLEQGFSGAEYCQAANLGAFIELMAKTGTRSGRGWVCQSSWANHKVPRCLLSVWVTSSFKAFKLR